MKRSPRILLSANSFWNLFNFRKNLILHLLDQGFQVTLVAPDDKYAEVFSRLSCKVVKVSMNKKGSNPFHELLTFLSYLKTYLLCRPDYILHYTIKPVLYGSFAAMFTRARVVNTITGTGTAFLGSRTLRRLVEFLYRLTQWRARRVLFQNTEDRDLFQGNRLVPSGRIGLVPGSGVDLNRFLPREKEESAVRFLLAARLLRDKGVGEFVGAARLLKTRNPSLRFQILGFLDAENRSAISSEDMEAWVSEGVVEYLGETESVEEVMIQSSCIVLPSYREGTPRSLLEALALSLPIITTDSAGCRETVIDGENGFLCKARDVDSLVLAIEKMLALSPGQREAMGRRGRELAETKFDERIVIGRTMKALGICTSVSNGGL
ncbi:MAG: glycosyltransferase family 4 protein [Candidatus Krumholzibacteria bacterium]|jgi:glycosyltransferase involved in cell wall biosynthesis|nr:glycosyltransferase family 4 protein [Candidatus Krumholzibacteria bacterium]